jgi:hypothetical protein
MLEASGYEAPLYYFYPTFLTLRIIVTWHI